MPELPAFIGIGHPILRYDLVPGEGPVYVYRFVGEAL